MYMRLLVLEDDVTLYIVHNSKGDQETKEKKKKKLASPSSTKRPATIDAMDIVLVLTTCSLSSH